MGLHEIVGWAFVPRAALAALGDPKLGEGITVKNPISADYEVMRTSLLPGLAEAARRNLSRGVSDVRIFEVGPVILPVAGDDHHHQSNVAAGLLIGRQGGWLKPGEPIDFFDLKRIVVELLAALGVREPVFIPPVRPPAFLHPGVSAEIRQFTASSTSVPLGLAGELHPGVAARLGIEVPAFYFELRLNPLEQRTTTIQAVAPPRFPAVTRDVSFWIDAAVAADAQRIAMRAAGETLLRELSVLEDFRDPRFVAPGKKGMLWTMTYRADDRTLTDEEVDAAHGRVVAALGRLLPIQIR